MSLKMASIGQESRNIVDGLLSSKKELGDTGLLNYIKGLSDVEPNDLARAFNLAGFNKESMKAAVSGTKFQETIDDMNDAYDAFSKNGSKSALQGLKNIGSEIKNMTSSIWGIIAANPLKSVGIALGTVAAGALIYGINKAINYNDDMIEKGQEAAKVINDQNESYQNQKKSLTELTAKYSELASGVKITGRQIQNINLSDDDFQTFLDTANQISDIAPSLTKDWDDNGHAILSAGTNVSELNKQVEDYIRLQRDLTFYTTKDNIQDQFKGISIQAERDQADIERYQSQIDAAKDKIDSLNEMKESISKEEGVLTFTVDSDTEIALREQLYNAGAYVQQNLNNDGTISLSIDTSELDQQELRSVVGIIEEIKNQTSIAMEEAQANLSKTTAISKQNWEEIFPSMQTLVSTSNMFDSWNDKEMATTFQDKLLSMVSNMDMTDVSKSIESSGKNVYDFIMEDVIEPLSSSAANKKAQDAWNNLLNFTPDKNWSISEIAKQRDMLLEQVASLSDSDYWTKSTLAKSLGYAYTDDNGKTKWYNKTKMDEIQAAMESDGDAVRKWMNSLTQEDFDFVYTIKTSGDKEALQSLESLKSALVEAKNAAAEEELAQKTSLTALKEKVTNATTAVSTLSTVMSEANSSTGMTADTISSVSEAFGKLESYDPAQLFIDTAHGVDVNTTALENLVDAQYKSVKSDFETNIKRQNESLKEQYSILKDASASDEAKNAANERIDAINKELESVKLAQSQYYALYQQQKEMFSDFNNIEIAKGTKNAGDEYTSILSEIKTAKEAWDKGLIGTDDFKSVAKYLSPNGFEDATNFIENYNKALRYFTEDESGAKNFLNDLEKKGLAVFETLSDGTKQWKTIFQDTEDAAYSMGMGYEEFMSVFGRLEDYGFINTFVSSAEEGSLQVEELSNKLAEAKTKLAQLQAQGADQTIIEAQQAEVDRLTSTFESSQQALNDYYTNSSSKYAEEIQVARKQLDLMKKDLDDKSLAPSVRNSLEEYYKSLADKYGIKYDASTYEIDESAYKNQLSNYGIDYTWESPATAEEMGFSSGTIAAQEYTDAVNVLKKAHEDNNSEMENAFNVLSEYNSQQLEGIKLSDNAYNVQGLEKAEDALQYIADQTGFTKDQILSALEGLGLLKPTVDSSDLTELSQNATEAQNKLNELTGSTYKFDFDTTDLEIINQQIETARKQLEQFRDENGNYDYTKDGAQEAASVYETSIRQQQNAELISSPISQVDIGSASQENQNVLAAAQTFMEAKNELDIQTQLSQQGLKNNLEEATKNAESAFQTYKTVSESSGNPFDIDSSGIQDLEDQLTGLSKEDIETKLSIDTSEAETKFNDYRQTVEGSSVTVNISASSDNLAETFAALPQTENTVINVDVNGKEDVDSLCEAIKETPPETTATIVCDVDNQEQYQQIMDAAANANANGSNINVKATVNEVDTSKTKELTSIDVKGNVTKVDSSQDLSVDIKGNLIEITPSSERILVDVQGNVLSVKSENDLEVNLHGNVKDVDLPENLTIMGSVNLPPENIKTLQDTINSVEGTNVDVTANVNGEPETRSLIDTIGELQSKQVDEVAKVSGTRQVDNLVNSINSLKSKTVTITTNYVENHSSSSGATHTGSTGQFGKKAYGTMIFPAHASGTAYNVLNMKNIGAYADGKVALPRNEKALVNEEEINGHSESIVRNGKWFLIPGGAHFENLKKGDIVFSAKQTDDLLKYGKTVGHARTYANGSLTNAYAYGSSFGGFGGGLSTSTSQTKSTKAYQQNTKSVEENTASQESNTEATDHSTTTLNWVERRMDIFADTVKNIADRITDYVSTAFKKSNLKKQIAAIDDEISARKHGAEVYMQVADEIASNYEYYDENGNKQSLTIPEEYKLKVQNGDWLVEEMDTSTDFNKNLAEAIQKYQEYYDKANECSTAVQELKNNQMDLFNDLINIPIEEAEKKIDRIAAKMDVLDAAASSITGQSGLSRYSYQIEADAGMKQLSEKLDSAKTKTKSSIEEAKKAARNSGDSAVKDYIYNQIKNGKYIDTKNLTGNTKKTAEKYNTNLQNQRKIQDQYNTKKKALSDMQKLILNNEGKPTYVIQNAILGENLKNKRDESKEYTNASKQAEKNRVSTEKDLNAVTKKVEKYASDMLKNSNVTKFLNASQINALKNGEEVDTTGIVDPTILQTLKNYNVLAEEKRTAEEKDTIALNTLTEAQKNATLSQAEYAQMAVENEQQKFANIKDYYDSKIDYNQALQQNQESKISREKALGASVSKSELERQRKLIENEEKLYIQQRDKLEGQLNKSVASGAIKEGSEEWKALRAEILAADTAANNAASSIANVANEIANIKLDQLEKTKSLFDAIISCCDSVVSMIETAGKYAYNDQDAMNALKGQIDYYEKKANNNLESAQENYANYAAAEANNGTYGGKSSEEWLTDYYNSLTEYYNTKGNQYALDKEIRELPLQEMNGALGNLKSVLDVITSGTDLKEAEGKYLDIMDYQNQIANHSEQIAKQQQINAQYQSLYEQMMAIGADARAAEYYDQWQSGVAELNKMSASVEELSDKIRDDFVESVKRSIDAISDMRDVLESELDIKKSEGKYLGYSDYSDQMRLNSQEYSNQLQIMTDRRKKYSEALLAGNQAEADQMLSEARQAEASANKLLAANAELEKSIQNLFRDTLQRELDALESAQAVLESQMNLIDAQSRDKTKDNFQQQIDMNMDLIHKQEALARENQRLYNLEVSKGNMEAAAEYLKAWKSADAEVNNLRADIESLGDDMREALLTKDIDKLLDRMEQLRNSMSTISDLINEDMMFDDNGRMTEFGITALAMDIKTYESETDSLKKLIEKRQKYIEEYNNGMNEYYSKNEYDEDMKNISQEIQEMLRDANTTRQAIVEMVAKTSKMEIDALNDVIDKRKELLQAQKDAYDFDKTLKSQTNDLTLLQKQKQALEGLTDKESQAKLQKLNKQIKEAQETLNDTITDHSFDLKIDGLDDLKQDISDAYDEYVKQLNANLEAITSTVTDATDTVVGSLGTVTEAITKLLSSYGVSGLNTDTIGYTRQYARGTKNHPGGSAIVNDGNGPEMIVLKDGSVLVPYLPKGSDVISAENTKRLLSNIATQPINAPKIETPKLDVKAVLNGNDGQQVTVGDVQININDTVDADNVMSVINKNINDIAKGVGNAFSKGVNKSSGRKNWG